MERKKEYILGKARDVVEIGSDWFDYRTDEVELPKIGAFCKKCCKETAIPIHPISMNGKPAYALRCPKCGNEYPMYKSMYIKRYIGYDLANGGHVNATHGQISTVSAMDKKAKAYYNQSENRVENRMCKAFGFTHEEYREMKKEWAQDEKEQHKKFEREKAEQHQVFKEREIQEKSMKRKELIEKGILKYKKGVGLINTETGEIVKL